MHALRSSLSNAGLKNARLPYYLRNFAQLLLPNALFRRRRQDLLDSIPPAEADAIADRIHYCNQLTGPFDPDIITDPFRFSLTRGRRNYHMDLREFTRYFDPRAKFAYRFGDETSVPAVPTLLKARPIGPGNGNAVLFKLNKIRHFVFVRDRIPFEQKRDRLVWRGNAAQENRRRFLERWSGHPLCDVGHAHKRRRLPPWDKPYLSIARQLECKFILALEGNDVASGLKWILSSNSLCFMCPPRFETWFMEGRLVPGRHYVPLAEDFSDVEEKIHHYRSHPDEAKDIIRQAQDHVAQFLDPAQERLVALGVLKKYLACSGQIP